MSAVDEPFQYDLFSRHFKANPFPTYAQMRREAPLHGHVAPDGRTIWYITRYEDVTAVLKDPRFIKNPHRGQAQSNSPGSYRAINENMLFADPPDHTRLRALVNQAFTPRRVEALAPRIQTITDELLNAAARQAEMDLIADLGLPLPVHVICELLGIPRQDREKVSDWSQAIISPGSRGLNYSARKQKVRHFITYLRQMFADRQTNPQDDLTTALVQAEEAGDKLNEAELSSMVALLLVTGHETTVNLIGNGALALLQHPGQLALLQADPTLWDGAIEELLRYDGPVETSTSRWAGEDIMFKGHLIRQGDLVRVVLASANRDTAVFPLAEREANPDQLDITRRDNKHLAFGLGIHYCLGAPLARLEGKIALGTLFTRFPNLRLARPADQLERHTGVLFRGLKRLPVAGLVASGQV
jgi:cytochrome P450